MESSTPVDNNAKFARYRSVRKAASKEHQVSAIETSLPIPPIPAKSQIESSQSQLNRAPSRYRRATKPRIDKAPLSTYAAELVSQEDTVKLPSRYHDTAKRRAAPSKPENDATESPSIRQQEHIEQWPKTFQATKSAQKLAVESPTFLTKDTQPRPNLQPRPDRQKATRTRSKTASSPQSRPQELRRSYDAAREEARLILEGEYDRLARLKKQQEIAEKERKAKIETQAERARVERATQQQNEEQSQATVQGLDTVEQTPSRARKWTIGAVDKQNSTRPLDRGDPEDADDASPKSPPRATVSSDTKTVLSELVKPLPSPHEISSKIRKFSTSKARQRRPTAAGEDNPPIPVQNVWEPRAGNGPPKTAVNGPQATDAPVSAVNAGERRVEIRFEKSKISLPVIPSTTVKDLLNSASVIMSQPIDPRTAVLLETYGPLGLERPLRRYEHIRDVMNSWDSDTQNHLAILSQAECAATGLEQHDAPTTQPSQSMVQLYHSRRPGKWEKHWMFLRPDGQVTASSKENDSNAANMFHLSDFDIYMPTRKELKKVRPPKKICFAVKSQQRSIMFESTENFVHFFATNDKAVADLWYNAVQSWRSWYLANILEQTTAGKAPPKDALAAVAAVNASAQPRPSTSHSRESIPYQLGTFKPLLDFDAGVFAYGDEEQRSSERPELEKGASPKRSLSMKNHNRAASNLDRSATLRRQKPPTSYPGHRSNQASQSKEMASLTAASTDAGFTGGGLLGCGYSVRKAHAEEAAAFTEDTNNAFMPTGLLTKQRSVRKVVKDDANPGVILDTNEGFTGKGLITKKASTRTFQVDDIDPGFIRDTNAGFTGGLLSVQRALTKKKSAASTRPGEPLVDLGANSQFMDHSLLRSVEGYEIANGQHMPIIDRSRGIEVKEKVGEAL